MEKRITRVIVITCFVFLIIPQAVFADSSWCWLTDTRPFDILPPVALATIVIEVLAIWLIPNTGKLMKTAVAVILLNAGPNYIVGAGFVILTLVLEIPIVYNLLKKHVDNKKKLLWSIIGSNIVTTAMVAVIERMVTNGYWA